MKVGEIEGYDVIYDKESDTISCKNLTVLASNIISAYESGLDRASVEGNLVMRKHELDYTLGCFTLTNNNSKQLIKTIKRCRQATA